MKGPVQCMERSRRKNTLNRRHSAIVLLSGGLDSSTLLYYVRRTYNVLALIFLYGQRHKRELRSALNVAKRAGVDVRKIRVPFPEIGSALLDKRLKLPTRLSKKIPITYVPARNIVFLSLGLAYAEAYGIEKVFIGINAIDYSGYPDCRPEFVRAFNRVIKVGTKRGVEGKPVKVLAPFINMSKAEIIRIGLSLGVPYELTWSCYAGGDAPCGKCDSCRLRAKGFREAGVDDPLLSR